MPKPNPRVAMLLRNDSDLNENEISDSELLKITEKTLLRARIELCIALDEFVLSIIEGAKKAMKFWRLA